MSEVDNQKVNRNENISEEVIDLSDLIRIYVHKWLFLCIVSGVAAIAVFLFISVFVNKSSRRQSISFELNYPEMEKGLYPDGTTFVYQDIVSEEFISKAIQSNFTEFGHLDVTEMVKNNAITIQRKTVKDKDGNETEVKGKFIFTVKSSFFKKSSEIEAFLTALANVTTEKIKTSASTVYYKLYLDSFDNADTFQSKLSLLKTQKEYISLRYSTWIEAFGEQYSVANTTLSRYLENVNLAFSSKEYDALNYELQKRQYVFNKGEDEELVCRLQIEILNDEFEDNKKKIQGLTEALAALREGEKSSPSDISGKSNESYYYEQIASYTERQVDIEREITKLEIQIENMSLVDETKKYNDKLIKVYNNLVEQTNTLEQVVVPAVYAEKTSAIFDSTGLITSGEKSATLFAAIAFIGIYLVTGFIILIIGSEDKKNNKNAEEE